MLFMHWFMCGFSPCTDACTKPRKTVLQVWQIYAPQNASICWGIADLLLHASHLFVFIPCNNIGQTSKEYTISGERLSVCFWERTISSKWVCDGLNKKHGECLMHTDIYWDERFVLLVHEILKILSYYEFIICGFYFWINWISSNQDDFP